MAAYDSLKSLVQQAIRTNGNNEITGQVLQNVLMEMIDELGGENGYAGVATPSTNPGAPDGKVFYFATEAGTYTHFDGATLAKGIHLLVFNGVTWSHQTLYTIDSEVTSGSNNLITSGAVYNKIINAINALDATVSKSAGADGLSLSLTETDGKVTSISGSIAPQTYDAYGAASAAQIAAATDATNKVNAAKTQILGDAASDYNTLGKLEDKIQAEASRAAAAENALNTDKADKATTLAGYGINDAYTKTEVNGLVSTPHQNYVTVPTYASLPATGSADTIYRVSNYNGSTSQVDASVYSEYAWNGSGYTFLRVDSQIGEVFDITVYNSNTKYADLAAALGTNGANVPSSIRRGGMSVKFVQSSDNNYTQFRCKTQSFSANPEDWYFEGDDTLVDNPEYLRAITDGAGHLLGWIRKEDGGIDWAVGVPKPVKEYVDTEIAKIRNGNVGTNIDGLDKIIAFLDDFSTSDTLAELLATKVDKEEGKSLIPTQYIQEVENPEYIHALTDNNYKITEATKKDGSKFFSGDVEVRGEMYAKEVSAEKMLLNGERLSPTATVEVNSIIEDPEGRLRLELDEEDKIIDSVEEDGSYKHNTKHIFNGGIELNEQTMTEFQQALRNAGFQSGGGGNYTDKSFMQIAKPKIAFVNITSPDGNAFWPTTKNSNFLYYMDFYDGCGNSFKKEIIFNAQGDSSLAFRKKNGSIDICNNNGWDDSDTFSIKFGDWVSQDSFHLKAYSTDTFRCSGAVCYDLYNQIMLSRGIFNDRPYKKYYVNKNSTINATGKIKQDVETNARCVPDGFPCIIYLNGVFYGVYSWQLKKHRDNYQMKKDNAKNIHLDGTLNGETIFGGAVDWTAFEVRNPKSLKDINGNKYDGDHPQELSNDDPFTSEVKGYILALSNYMSDIRSKENEYLSETITLNELKNYINLKFDVNSMIDYLLFCNFTGNYDGLNKNWQFITYDGVLWFVVDYDNDGTFGNYFNGNLLIFPEDTFNKKFSELLHQSDNTKPSYWIYKYFKNEFVERYTILKEKNILTVNNIISKFKNWIDAVGLDFYDKEYKKWTDQPCYRDSKINKNNWEQVSYAEAGNTPTMYDSTTVYSKDEYVRYGDGQGGLFVFKSNIDNNSEPIITEIYTDSEKPYFGHYDSIFRIKNWLSKRVEVFESLIENINN